MIEFYQMRPTDAPLLARIGAASLMESHGHSAPLEIMQEYVDEKFSIENCTAELADDKNHFQVLLYNQQPAGYFKIIPGVPNKFFPLNPVTKLERLYLLKEYYDLRLGKPLLEKAIEISQSKGDRGMWLNVWVENPRAIRFYQKHGFTIAGETDFRLTATRSNPNWVMVKSYSEG